MPDADDFDVESLRALLRGDSPATVRGAKLETGSAQKPACATAGGKAAGEKTKASPPQRRRTKGPKSTASGKKPRKP
jgi:hypothetical protein